MRITANLTWKGGASFFPYQYHEHLQGLIYYNLPVRYAQRLHEEGFPYENRNFKLFTFSRLFGKRGDQKVQGGLLFYPPVHFIFSSPIGWIMEGVAESMMRLGKVKIGHNDLVVESLKVHHPPEFSSAMKIQMLSPMTTYSTIEKEGGRKYTHYYTPHDRTFSGQITQNLYKKHYILFRKDVQGEIKINPFFEGGNPKILRYKGTVIKGWDGRYLIEGPPELIEVSYHCGLGSKNSQGFGMWEIWE